MHDFIPHNVTPSNSFRIEWNKIVDWMKRNELKSSSDILVNQTSYGTTLTVSDKIKKKWNQGGTSTTATTGGNTDRGQWTASPPTPFMTFDKVYTTEGYFMSTIDNNPNYPTSGIGWVGILFNGNWI